jgi:arginine-tRNA-protein transferase
MSARDTIRLFQTSEHACGYWPERSARDLVLDPAAPELARLYPAALTQGFRRSGGHVYRPNCRACQACLPVRISIKDFTPNRTQRRALLKVKSWRFVDQAPEPEPGVFALYRHYLQTRHRHGGMDEAEPADFENFIRCDWSPTRFLCAYDDQDVLRAVAVTDVTREGLSAVYTFFDPDLAQLSLGTVSILQQIAWAKRLGVPHLYLGFWLDGHPKMHYKRQFSALEARIDGVWQPLT